MQCAAEHHDGAEGGGREEGLNRIEGVTATVAHNKGKTRDWNSKMPFKEQLQLRSGGPEQPTGCVGRALVPDPSSQLPAPTTSHLARNDHIEVEGPLLVHSPHDIIWEVQECRPHRRHLRPDPHVQIRTGNGGHRQRTACADR